MTKHWIVAALLFSTASLAFGEDWPQWMGPQRDGVWNETGILEKFPASGAKVKWRQPVSLGYAGPAVVGNQVFVFDYVLNDGTVKNDPGGRVDLQGKERLQCLDAETGKVVWKYEYEQAYAISYPSGPRCTPTVVDGKVYILGAEGMLSCVDAEKGTKVWSRELKKDFKTESPIWGFSSHPLVDGDRLFCVVGGEGSVAVAFDKNDGKELWRALSASESGYAPPSIIEHQGVRQLLIWDADKLNSLNPESGKVYWSQPLKPGYGMAIMTPQHKGDYLFASGIGNVGALLKLSSGKPAVEPVWWGEAKTALYAANSTPLIDGDTLYGVDCDTGFLMAVRLSDGKRLWGNRGTHCRQTPWSARDRLPRQARRSLLHLRRERRSCDGEAIAREVRRNLAGPRSRANRRSFRAQRRLVAPGIREQELLRAE